MAEDRRPKRRCVARKALVPSASHYVGYVEEDETPEMIMKKFEALEKVMQGRGKQDADAADNKENEDAGAAAADAAAGPSSKAPEQQQGGDMELDETQLVEVFKQTSIFNVRSALANNTVLMAGDHPGGERGDPNDSDGALSSDEGGDQLGFMRGFWSDEDFFGDKAQQQGKERRRRAGGARAPRDPAARLRAAQKRSDRSHQLITQYNKDTRALIRRRVRVADPDAILQIRVPPPPLPASWGRAVRPYAPRAARRAAAAALAAAPEPAARASSFEAPDLCSFDYRQLPSSSYQAVLINTGWERQGEAAAAAAGGGAAPGPGSAASGLVEGLRRLPIQQLCPTGFVFVWAEKHHLHAVCKQLHSWGYAYVENLTWVLMAPNNSILRLAHAYTCKSHLTLLIFRKEGAPPAPLPLCCPPPPPRRSQCAPPLQQRAGLAAAALLCARNSPPPPAHPPPSLRHLPPLAQARARTSSCATSAAQTSSSTASHLQRVSGPGPAPRGVLARMSPQALLPKARCCRCRRTPRAIARCVMPAGRTCCRARVVGAGAGHRQHRDNAAHGQGRVSGAVGGQGGCAPRLDTCGAGQQLTGSSGVGQSAAAAGWREGENSVAPTLGFSG
jgi:hypothetical protein